jgi:hypothetical protein
LPTSASSAAEEYAHSSGSSTCSFHLLVNAAK